jgi:hypothetical protein
MLSVHSCLATAEPPKHAAILLPKLAGRGTPPPDRSPILQPPFHLPSLSLRTRRPPLNRSPPGSGDPSELRPIHLSSRQ